MSLSLYALVALQRDSARATEAAMKYFVLGALASGMLLYGMSMIYGATGIARRSTASPQALRWRRRRQPHAAALRPGVRGLRHRVQAGRVPFHMWVPDVYHGAPTPITLLIGTAPEARRVRVRAAAAGAAALEGAGVRLAADADRAVAAVDGARQHHRHRADQHQAHARVLDDRPHGLHAAGLPGRRPQRLLARRCSTWSPTCSRRSARSA